MKKYFITDTNEEIQAGETLQLDFAKEVKHGRVKTTQDITLNEVTIPWLLKTGIIEEREVEEEEDNTPENDFEDEEPCEALAELIEDFEKLEEKVERLETLAVGVCKEMLTLIKELLKEDKEEKKNAQPKKK